MATRYWGISFQNCDGLLNGIHQDFYETGNPHIRGNFHDGRPKDSLVIFYYNGHIKRSNYYLRNHHLIQEYDSLGNLLKVSRNSNRLPVLTDYSVITFFNTGGVHAIEKVKNGYLRYTEYYPNKKPRYL